MTLHHNLRLTPGKQLMWLAVVFQSELRWTQNKARVLSLLFDVFCSHPATQTRSTACQWAVCSYQHLLQWNVFKVFLSSHKNTLKRVFPDFDRSLPHLVEVEASRFTLSSLWDWSSSRTCRRISISITLRQEREAKKNHAKNLLKSFAVWGILFNRSMASISLPRCSDFPAYSKLYK